MVSQKITCIVLLALSTIAILACLVINFEAWIVYTVAIFGIPLWILSLGLLTMAKPDPEDAEYYTSEDDAIELLKQYLRTFGTLFSDEQRKHIESFIHQGFLPDTDAFITEIDKMRIIREEIRVNDQEIISISR